jgi:hypothetical protein
MADANNRPSLLPLLEAVRGRPGMYLGVPSTEYGMLLDRLEAWINGYREAVFRHSMEDAGLDAFARFRDYLGRQQWWNVSDGVIRTIRRESPSDEEAWATFWRLWSEFLASEDAQA